MSELEKARTPHSVENFGPEFRSRIWVQNFDQNRFRISVKIKSVQCYGLWTSYGP